MFFFQNTLREEITEQVRWNVNRDSMEDKQTSLMSLMPALKRDIVHQVCMCLKSYNTLSLYTHSGKLIFIQ